MKDRERIEETDYVQVIAAQDDDVIVNAELPCSHVDETDTLDEVACEGPEGEILPWDWDEKRSLAGELLRCKRRLDELEDRIRRLENKQ